MVKLIVDLEASDRFNEFSKHRAAFEAFLINHKMFVNQLTVKHGSMVKGFLPLKEYYEFVLARLGEGMDELSIEESLGRAEAYRTLVKEKPILTQRAKAFSTDAKQFKMLSDVLANAFICNVCGARLDKKSMHLDHATAKRDGGLGTLDNGQWLHPYCDSTYKDLIASERKDESGN